MSKFSALSYASLGLVLLPNLLVKAAALTPVFHRADLDSAYVTRTNADLPPAEHSLIMTPFQHASKNPFHPETLFTHWFRRRDSSETHVASLPGVLEVQGYLVNATFGKDQVFPLIVSTGSSDIWIPQAGYKCFDLSGNPQPESYCDFGNEYDSSKSSTFELVPNRNFNLSYASDEFFTGIVGTETVTVAGLTVKKQEFGLVQNAAWDFGDGIIAGFIGFGYPGLTKVYAGTNPDADNQAHPATYNPFIFTAVESGVLKNPIFSISIDRGTFDQQEFSNYTPGLGVLALGGVAPGVPTIPGVTVTVPVLPVTFQERTGLLLYNIHIDKYIFPGSSKLDTSSSKTVLDHATSLNYIPTAQVKAYAAAFVPAAYVDPDFGLYVAVCKAVVPEFVVVIGGVSFPMPASDQLFPLGVNDSNGNALCVLGTQDGATYAGGQVSVMGGPFLHNVVTTFNVKDNEITLSLRAPYNGD